ncbi:MAG: response regulator transcription factor [Nitrospira sp.]|nr:response regulator transcription factor [Nitrospira sp.]
MYASPRDDQALSFLADRLRERESTAASVVRPQPALRWRVLIVDGHAAIREMMRIILEPCGDLIEVVADASDGESAINQAVLHKVDLVLMDVNLASPNGVETTRRLKQSMPHVVILGLSADYTPHIYNSMIAAGAAAFVRKQDAVDMLFRTIVYAMFHYCRPREKARVLGSSASARFEDGSQAAVRAPVPGTSPPPRF